MKRRCAMLIVLITLNFTLFGQSETIKQLKSDNLVEASFYFYPSTLRAFNQGNNPDFNRLIREIRKMSLFRLDESCTQAKMEQIRSNTIQAEGYETLLSLEGKEFDLYVIGKEEPTEYILFIEAEGNHYITDLLGSIDLLQIPKLYRNISNRDSTFDSGLFSLVGRVTGQKESKPEMPLDSVQSDTILSKNLEN